MTTGSTSGLTVVTGGSGYVGTNLVLALRAAGRPVRVVDLRRPGISDPDVSWIQADVRDRAAMRRAFAGADVVYHLAAIISLVGGQRGRVASVNVGGVRSVAEAALPSIPGCRRTTGRKRPARQRCARWWRAGWTRWW
jgi:dihydroflavonol-4-reductase